MNSETRPTRIDRIMVQRAPGQRLTPVAPNAFAAYRGTDNADQVLRVRAGEFEGIGCGALSVNEGDFQKLLGVDPCELFTWGEGDRITGPAAAYVEFFEKHRWCDVAFLDLVGKITGRTLVDLLGKQVREAVQVYDSSLYMEDLLTAEQTQNLAYIQGALPDDPVEMLARKAEWLLGRPEGFTMLKIKTGRSKWMPSFEAALERDIAVTQAVLRVLGSEVKLLADTNKAYAERPQAAFDYLAAVGDIFVLEEPFPETDIESMQELKQRLRASGNRTLLAAGESHYGGIPENVAQQRVSIENRDEPLLDIEQADMNQNGILAMMRIARERAALEMTVAPHNFGSKLGFYTQVHLGLVTPNWAFSEMDDSQVPGLKAHGIRIRNGHAVLTGEPGLGVFLDEAGLEVPSFRIEL